MIKIHLSTWIIDRSRDTKERDDCELFKILVLLEQQFPTTFSVRLETTCESA